MTRQECERKVLDLMEKIRDTIYQYSPEIKSCSLGISEESLWAFKLEEDENGEPIRGKYLLDAFRTFEEG